MNAHQKPSPQNEAWKEALRSKQAKALPAKYGRQPNPGACQARSKAAGRKGGIRRQGSKRG